MNRASGPKNRAWLPAVFVVLLAGCVACASTVGGHAGATPVPVLSAAQIAQQSLVNLGEAGVLHYHGSLVNPDGKQLGLDVSVTATGEAGGSVSVGGQRGALVVANGGLYVDAPGQFWSLLSGDPGSEASAVDSRWVRVPSVTIGVDIGAALVPSAFSANLLRRNDTGDPSSFAAQPATTVHGTAAVRVAVGDSTVDLATAGTHGVLHVDLPADFGSARNVSLDVADVTATEAGIYQNLNQQAQQLKTAVDTNVDIEQGNQSWGTCTASGCSVIVTFTNAGPIATKVVVSGNWKGDNHPVGTCQAVVGPVAAGKSTTAACTNSSARWTTFYNHAHATPGSHPYEVDWTAEALAAPPNLAVLTAEATAAATPAPANPKRTKGVAFVYEIAYQDSSNRTQPWKYGVTQNTSWRTYADAQLPACRAAVKTSCTASLVTGAGSRPSADALARSLAAKATTGTTCPPGQWVGCATSPTH